MFTQIYSDLKIAQSDDRYVSGFNKIYQFVWAVLVSVRTAKRHPVRHVIVVQCKKHGPGFNLEFQVSGSEADTSPKRTAALVLRVSALERVDCTTLAAPIVCSKERLIWVILDNSCTPPCHDQLCHIVSLSWHKPHEYEKRSFCSVTKRAFFYHSPC